MIDPSWRRIAGYHCLDDGGHAAVWIAHDKETDTLHLYDACKFQMEVPAVIAEGMNARGRWIPIAWTDKGISKTLQDRGCNTLPDAAPDSASDAEMVSREIWERMRTGRFKVDRRLKEWLDEFKTYGRRDGVVPKGAYPLMAATRHAVGSLEWARRQAPKRRQTANYAQVAIV